MSSNKAVLLLLSLLSLQFADAASVCFSLPATPPGSTVPYAAGDCGGTMPATGYPVGTQCTIPSSGCASPSLSKATCLDGVSNNEGYWSQPVCTVSATPGFTTTKAATTVVTTVANTEYASLVHLDDLFTTTSFRIGFNSGLDDMNVAIKIYTMQDPVGATAGPGDLVYSVTGAFAAAGGSVVSPTTGLEVVATITDMMTGAGDLLVILPTPLNFGNDYFLSVNLSSAGLVVPMECTAGPNVKQYWTRTSSSNPFVSTNIGGTGFACIANVVYVLDGENTAEACQPTLLTATIGYGGGSSDPFDQDEPPMPYLDFTRSGFTGGPYLNLNFTYPTGVYDDIQFLPYAGAQAYGPPPTPTTGGGGAPPCGTTFQVFHQSTSGCQTTATVRADFLELITEHVASSTQVCGWQKAPAPIQYQGVFYTQWSGTIQIVTYQTVALFGSVSLRIKEAYANVVVRSPIVTSNAIASPVSVADASVFQWTIVDQHLDSDSLPYQSVTNIQTRVSAGYELTATASISSGSAPTAWTLAGGLTSATLTTSSAACTGTSTACTQAWALVVENSDSAVCSLDAVVTITYSTACNADLLASGGCDSNVDGRTFVTTVVLSSVDFCRVVGGVTSLTMTPPTVQVPSSSLVASATFLTNAAMSSFPAVPTVFVVGSSIGVYFTISSQPQIPITISAVSARIYDANERSHFSLYSDVREDRDGNGGPFYYATAPNTAGPTASAFFNLPTGDQGTGTIYTPWLLTNTGGVNNVIVSVTASVSYDNVLLGETPHFVTFDIPLSAAEKTPKASSPALTALASAIRAAPISPQAIVTGTITQETTLVPIQASQGESSDAAMSTAAIAGIAAGSAAVLVIIIVAVVAVMAKSASSAAVAAKYAPPPAAAAVAPAPSAGPAPTISIKEDFYAPRLSTA